MRNVSNGHLFIATRLREKRFLSRVSRARAAIIITYERNCRDRGEGRENGREGELGLICDRIIIGDTIDARPIHSRPG